jgi:hypothetical protein
MEETIEMGSGAMIYIPSFIRIQKLMDGGDTKTHWQAGDSISLHLLFQNKESRLNMSYSADPNKTHKLYKNVPQTKSGHGAYLIKHRDNFAFLPPQIYAEMPYMIIYFFGFSMFNF